MSGLATSIASPSKVRANETIVMTKNGVEPVRRLPEFAVTTDFAEHEAELTAGAAQHVARRLRPLIAPPSAFLSHCSH